MRKVRSTLAAGHIFVRVKDLQKSAKFYERAGLPAFMRSDSIAIIELRGGTHIILSESDEAMAPSRCGQMGQSTGERFDLMIEGNKREDLELYRIRLVGQNIEVSEINDEPYHGHYFFSIKDPDDNVIHIYTSHELKYVT